MHSEVTWRREEYEISNSRITFVEIDRTLLGKDIAVSIGIPK